MGKKETTQNDKKAKLQPNSEDTNHIQTDRKSQNKGQHEIRRRPVSNRIRSTHRRNIERIKKRRARPKTSHDITVDSLLWMDYVCLIHHDLVMLVVPLFEVIPRCNQWLIFHFHFCSWHRSISHGPHGGLQGGGFFFVLSIYCIFFRFSILFCLFAIFFVYFQFCIEISGYDDVTFSVFVHFVGWMLHIFPSPFLLLSLL